MRQALWTVWTLSLARVVVELDDRVTPPGLAIELDVELADGVRRATWRFEDGTAIGGVRVGIG